MFGVENKGIGGRGKKGGADSGGLVVVGIVVVVAVLACLEIMERCRSHWVHDAAIFVQDGGRSNSKRQKCPI